jgi:hypothetical protein
MIGALVVALEFDDFWSNVHGSAAAGIGFIGDVFGCIEKRELG